MDALLNKRRALKGSTTRIETVMAGHQTQPLTDVALKLYLGKTEKITTDLEELHHEMARKCTPETFALQGEEYDALSLRLDDLHITIATILRTNQSTIISAATAPTTPTSGHNPDIRLPNLEIPTFSGNYLDWLSFHDLYLATVHNNLQLSDARKFQYLKSLLRDEAALLVKSIPITDANYPEAWSILTNRYNNTREIIDAHLKRLFTQPKVNQESALELRKLIDTTSECIRGLKVLNEPVDNWDSILVYTVKEKLDTESRRQWELSLTGTNAHTFEDLRLFLEQRARALAAAATPGRRIKSGFETRKTTLTHVGTTRIKCLICQEDHTIYRCPKFAKVSVDERWDLVKKKSLCFNCLRPNHASPDCTMRHCTKCNSKHNTLLHSSPTPVAKQETGEVEHQVQTHLSRDGDSQSQVLLSTAIIQVKDQSGKCHEARALLDSASEASFITENCAKKLQLTPTRFNVSIGGIGTVGMGSSRNKVSLMISSALDKSFTIGCEALILKKVTHDIPSMKVDPSSWEHLKGLALADPNFHSPREVDILLGADVYFHLLQEGLCRGPENLPSAFNTVFGWALSGMVKNSKAPQEVFIHHCTIEEQVRRFWEIEEIPVKRFLTPEEDQCEKHFESTHSRDENGRYIVRLPFKSNPENLRSSKKIAIRRFMTVEKHLEKNPAKYETYQEFMAEYELLGHMEPVPSIEPWEPSVPHYYTPHFGVTNEKSSTTKMRVVFDASAKTVKGNSLNDVLRVGPKLQDDLVNILIRFRIHAIAMKADIAKMYRQIWVHPEDTTYQRIVWRPRASEPIQDYKLLTVTYGTASAPYLATKVLQHLASEVKEKFPKAAETLTNDFSMDDLLSGANSVAEALQLQTELLETASSAGFDIRKWVSNEPLLLESVAPDKREMPVPLLFEKEAAVTTLGLHWTPATDDFSYLVTSPPYRATMTKRTVLSDTAKIFDPLGLLSPVTITAKILLQDIWKHKQDWDEPLTDSFVQRWQTFRNDLPGIETIRIPRHISQPEVTSKSLQGFCDASEKAYAAAVYMQTPDANGKVQLRLIAAKTKVAPTKTVNVQRLELCAALLLAKVMKLIQESIASLRGISITCWSDSRNVLAWLRSPPHRWKTFIANRVAEIQETVPTAKWIHVPGKTNPADCASRGTSAVGLRMNSLWWDGPLWLIEETLTEQYQDTKESEACLAEERKTKSYLTQVQYDSELLLAYSCLRKLRRVTAVIFRFTSNARQKNKKLKKSGPLTPEELELALYHWVKVVQLDHYAKEISQLKGNQPISAKSKLLSLQPYLGTHGVLRVGGRLRNANLPIAQAHPAILPRKSPLTELLITHEHNQSFHGGVQLVISTLQKKFWVVGIRDAVRYHLKKCVRCTRFKAASVQQMMGDLPPSRVNKARAFLKCGVDYAGPFLLRVIKGRGHKMFKAYLAVFVCFTTRAIHLELVSDLSTAAFLAALKRFVARRGRCTDIYSDCGTNFVGANREMKDFINMINSAQHQTMVYGWLADESIKWHFNPPAAPHMGGLWEAGVKSVKYHLKRVIGNANLTYEEMQTLICQIEACLNSRPLTALSTDPHDLTALTPGHFLIGDALTAIPEPDLTSENINRLTRWQLGQKLLQHFWRRWRNEYLSRLQQRPKWATVKENLVINDLVLLKDEGQPPNKWKMGRILHLHPGTDGLVRVVTIRTATDKELKRPVMKLCKLPLD